ncbi:MAG: right-handed parallel beta-helix repeat-containing protein [Planctomycetia bacterium]|nr:right-handed parallel beta-helix repeat-containing protein [Planctomycetia bacterium]
MKSFLILFFCMTAGVFAENIFVADEKTPVSQALEQSRKITGPRTLVLRGTHVLTEPLLLDARDNDLTLLSENGLLTGGVTCGDWKNDGELDYVEIPENIRPRTLFLEDGTFCPPAVFPLEGHLQHTCKPQNLWWRNSTNGGWNRPLSEEELTHVTLVPTDLPAEMEVENAEITLFHSWDASTVPIKSLDRTTGEVVLESRTEHPAGAFGNRDYVLCNVRQGMAPGRWYFDKRRHRVYFQWGNQPKKPVVVSPLEHLILADGVKNLTLCGLTFRFTNPSFRTSGLRSINMPGAVEFRNCENVTLETCTLQGVGGHGIKMLRCRNTKILKSVLEQTGAGGIFTHECEDETIAECLLRNIGQQFFSSVSLHVGGKSQLVFVQDGKKPEQGTTRILHNQIDGSPYCGITCNGGPHVIDGNRIRNCMRVLNDGAAIYCSRAVGTVVRNNHAENIRGKMGLAIAYYFDEDSRLCVLENNESVDCPRPFLAHRCRDILIAGNRFSASDAMKVMLHHSDHFVFRDNRFTTDGDLYLDFFPEKMTEEEKREKFPFGSLFSNTQLHSGTGKYLILETELPPVKGILRK